MIALRFSGSLFLLLAVIALVADATRAFTVGPPGLLFTSASRHWSEISPATLAAAQRTVRGMAHPLAWDWGLAPLLVMPAWALLGLVSALLLYLGRRRSGVDIFVN
jgi:hypothetical protein